jgi:hypothetical protein
MDLGFRGFLMAAIRLSFYLMKRCVFRVSGSEVNLTSRCFSKGVQMAKRGLREPIVWSILITRVDID